MSSILSNLQILTIAPVFNVQLVLDGLLIGAVFALAAYGMALVWGVMNIINITQGEFVVLGGYVAVLFADRGIHPLFAVPVAAAFLFAVGWGFYRAVIFRVVDKDLFISLLATFGISILLQQLMNTIFGSDVRVANAHLESWQALGRMVTVSQVKVLSFIVCVALGIGLMWFLKSSRLGQAIRATAQNARAARVLGIDTDRVYAMTYGLNAAICGTAGALIAMAYTIHPYIGLPYTIRSFMIVIVAGLGNLGAVILSGIGLGVAENYAGFILGAQFQLAFVFLLLVAVLVARNWRLQRQRRYLK
jgi:branched-chain amino acid transport system permease protein